MSRSRPPRKRKAVGKRKGGAGARNGSGSAALQTAAQPVLHTLAKILNEKKYNIQVEGFKGAAIHQALHLETLPGCTRLSGGQHRTCHQKVKPVSAVQQRRPHQGLVDIGQRCNEQHIEVLGRTGQVAEPPLQGQPAFQEPVAWLGNREARDKAFKDDHLAQADKRKPERKALASQPVLQGPAKSPTAVIPHVVTSRRAPPTVTCAGVPEGTSIRRLLTPAWRVTSASRWSAPPKSRV